MLRRKGRKRTCWEGRKEEREGIWKEWKRKRVVERRGKKGIKENIVVELERMKGKSVVERERSKKGRERWSKRKEGPKGYKVVGKDVKKG